MCPTKIFITVRKEPGYWEKLATLFCVEHLLHGRLSKMYFTCVTLVKPHVHLLIEQVFRKFPLLRART